MVFAITNCNAQDIKQYCTDWNTIDSLITIKQIDKDEAVKKINEFSKKLKAKLFSSKRDKNIFVFPLNSFGSIDSIRFFKGGKDYEDDKYDYFQGSNSIGHPAHDIIIDDKDKDLNDDITGKPVDVVSVSYGIVIAINITWQPGSLLRGGKYVKVYDPDNNRIWYYSHLSVVSLFPGDTINAGDKIGEVGRSGRRAILKEGSTHLHIGTLKLVDGYPLPEDYFEKLRSSYLKIKATTPK